MKFSQICCALFGLAILALSNGFAATEPDLPADPLSDLIRSWREFGIYQKALIEGVPAVEGAVLTSLDLETLVDQIKSTCETYQLVYSNNSQSGDLPFTLVRVQEGELERTFILLPVPGGYTLVKFSFQDRADPDLISILDLLPELSQMGDQIQFKKENFADNSHSALLIVESQEPTDLAAEKARSVLLAAGWQQMVKNGDPLLANLFTKGKFSLQLQAQAAGEENTSITCTILERKEGRSVSEGKSAAK